MGALSSSDREFWEENGYVVIPDAVPPENLDAVLEAVQAFTGKDCTNPEECYDLVQFSGAGLVNLTVHQALWDNRQAPRVHAAFAELLGTEELIVSRDRVAVSPPVSPRWEYEGFIHWDMDSTIRPIPLRVQGVLYLTDTAADQGGFQCVPGFHRKLEEWARTQPPDRHPKTPDATGLDIVPIPGKAGDLLIWHGALLHGNGRNTSKRPRLAQYILMHPAGGGLGSGVLPLARTYQAVIADALGVREAGVERWLRRHRGSDLAHARIEANLGEHPTYPGWRVRSQGREVILRKSLVEFVDETTVEVHHSYARQEGLPVVARIEEGLAASIQRIPAPQHEPRLSPAQLARLPELLLRTPAAFDFGDRSVWNEHHWPNTISGGEAYGRDDRRIWNEWDVAQLMHAEFGLELDVEEARLSPLGRKLAGVDSW